MLQDKQAEEEENQRGRQAGLNKPEKGAASGLGSCGVASGVA